MGRSLCDTTKVFYRSPGSSKMLEEIANNSDNFSIINVNKSYNEGYLEHPVALLCPRVADNMHL